MRARRLRILAALGALSLAIVAAVLRWRAPNAAAPPRFGAIPSTSPSALPIAAGPIEPEITVVDDDTSFELHVFAFRLARSRFRVVDLGMTREVERARSELGASLVVNGGFFDRTTAPEGLVVSEGSEISKKSDSLGGGVVTVTSDRAELHAAETFTLDPRTVFAIQARPRLVVDGKAHVVHDDGRAAERTALCIRDQGRVLEVIVARGESSGSGPTLSIFADMLASRECEGALNLDGGPSTGVSWRGPDGAHTLAPRGPLRHGIAIWLRD